MRALLVDDDRYFCEVFLRDLYENCEAVGIQIECDICHDAKQVLNSIGLYDIYFLDIEMPGMNGLKVAEELRRHMINKEIIFLSFYEHYVWKAFDVRPSAFIRKSQLNADLHDALEMIRKHHQRNRAEVEIFRNHKSIEKIKPIEVLYCKSEEHYVRFVSECGESKLYRMKLEQAEEVLQEYHFIRVHSRYLVNLEYIHTIYADKIGMINGQDIPVSRAYKKRVQMIVFNWKEQKEETCSERNYSKPY